MAENSFRESITFRFWKYIFIGFFSVILFFVLLSFGVFGELPSFEEIENPKSALASEIYTEDGVLLGKFYLQNRRNVTYNKLPKNLVECLLATEDSRFYKHSGIDMQAIAGVIKGQFTGDNRGGGSTITQQLAKNLFPRDNPSKIGLILRKFKEWIIAIKLERSFTKQEIIAAYFNTVEFSDNAFGIQSASKTYFGKNVDSLNVEESAVLVGMLKAPYKYNPRIHPEASIQRRNVVINQLYEYKYITKQTRDSLMALPLVIHFNQEFHFDGVAPYFREYLRMYLKNYFEKNETVFGKRYNLYKDGLKIYTTLNFKMQEYAEEAVRDHLTEYQKIFFSHWKGGNPWKGYEKEFLRIVKDTDRYRALKEQGLTSEQIIAEMGKPVKMRIFSWAGEKDTVMSPIDSIKYHRMFLQSGFLVMDPHTGKIKAWAGGINYKYFQYDHVNVHTKRQVGSTFKPFVYTVAVDQKGYSPCFRVPNARITFEVGNPKWKIPAPWSPHNSGGKYGGSPTLKDALAQSLNTVTARLMHEVGPVPVIELLKNLGLDSSTKILPYPSICLGTPEISLFEMVGAYSVFANEGVHVSPSFISRIEDRNGNIIQEFYPKQKEILRPEVASVMIELMRGVVSEGTAKRLIYKYDLKNDIVGKTGTTQNNSDGWFMGLTPDLIAGAWVGCEDRYVRFRSTAYGQGAAMALPIWGKFFQLVSRDSTLHIDFKKKFPDVPESERTIITDCSRYRGWGVDGRPLEGAKEYGGEYDDAPTNPEPSSDEELKKDMFEE